jgi:hypothetical protein
MLTYADVCCDQSYLRGAAAEAARMQQARAGSPRSTRPASSLLLQLLQQHEALLLQRLQHQESRR